MSVAEELEKLKTEIPAGVNLVAVSKFHPAEMIREAYAEGQRLFGESRVQELLEKIKELPDDIKWHFIGHLQTNKVKQLVGNVAMIESVDSERLLDLIDAESEKKGVMTRVLMQVHVAKEETKFGFLPAELKEYFSSRKFEQLTNTHICGVMGMASNTDDLERVREDFRSIANIYNEIKIVISPDLRGFDTLSMGMSHDWKIAVEEGANLIRIGSRIFGDRY
ncbi:MAG: YggS family pyridoxal phosphate-dependent enzyme [Muribaculaceae bacterium]|nr:YggS family pyridoxal phosphate-dependent enzyme [Muribaculaceae bacterium]